MTRKYRNKYVISPGTEGNSDDSNYEIIHVVQCNPSTEDMLFDVERQTSRVKGGSGDSSSAIQQMSQPQAQSSQKDGQPDPPGLMPDKSVSVPDKSRRTRPSNESCKHEEKEHTMSSLDSEADFGLKREKDIQLFAHSRLWTSLAILCSWVGFTLALLARNSTEFVSIKVPMYFDPNYNTVTTLGMVNLELCYNASYIPGYEGCIIDKLGSEEVSDIKYQLARSFSSLVVWLGGFSAVMITSSIFWYSINLRPLGFFFLISYFLESFSFIFLDSEVCRNHGCIVDTGGYFGIVASLFWIFSSVSASRMDAYKFQQAARKKRRHLRMLRRQARMQNMKKTSTITEITNVSLTDSDSWENSSNDTSSNDSSSEAEVFNQTLVSSFPASTDAVETTFVGFADIEQGEQDPPEELQEHVSKHMKRKSRRSQRRVRLVEDDIDIESRGHESSPQTPSKIRSRIEVHDRVPRSPLEGSAKTINRFRVRLVRHQTT